jgi:ribosomal protein L7/L12
MKSRINITLKQGESFNSNYRALNAIKAIRQVSGIGLKEAKDIMDAISDDAYTEETKQWFANAKKFNQAVREKVLSNQTYINTDK